MEYLTSAIIGVTYAFEYIDLVVYVVTLYFLSNTSNVSNISAFWVYGCWWNKCGKIVVHNFYVEEIIVNGNLTVSGKERDKCIVVFCDKLEGVSLFLPVIFEVRDILSESFIINTRSLLEFVWWMIRKKLNDS